MMDPNAVLLQAQAAMRLANAIDQTGMGRLQALADAAAHYAELDAWLQRRGYLPAQWDPITTAMATTPEREGGCHAIRYDHASPPYGPRCTLDHGHGEERHHYPYPITHNHVNGQCVPIMKENQ